MCSAFSVLHLPLIQSFAQALVNVSSAGAADKTARCDQWKACCWTPSRQDLIKLPKSLWVTSCGFVSPSLSLSAAVNLSALLSEVCVPEKASRRIRATGTCGYGYSYSGLPITVLFFSRNTTLTSKGNWLFLGIYLLYSSHCCTQSTILRRTWNKPI